MNAAAAPTAPPAPGPARYRIPSLGFRLAIGGVRVVFFLILLVVLPVTAIHFLAAHSIPFPISAETEAIYGIAVSVLLAARYVLRPTGAYGPLCMAVAAATIALLVVLLMDGVYTLSVPAANVSVTIDLAWIVALLLLVPLFSLFAGLVTTVEDARWPGERLEFDFPL